MDEKNIGAKVAQRAADISSTNQNEKLPEITPAFIDSCLDRADQGDAELYGRLYTYKILFAHNQNNFLIWSGQHLELDLEAQAAAYVSGVGDIYRNYHTQLSAQEKKAESEGDEGRAALISKKRKAARRKERQLRTKQGRAACLDFVKTTVGMHIVGNEIDQKPLLLACANGVVDLETGRLRPGRFDDYLMKASPYDYLGIHAPREAFEKCLYTSLDGNIDEINFLRRWFGYAATGLTDLHKFLVLTGRGWNGKGVILGGIMNALGSGLAGPIRSEMLLDQGRVKSSSGPSPDTMGLLGKRLITASETNEGHRWDGGAVKLYTGGDPLTGRYPHDKRETTFLPTHHLVLLTNHRPRLLNDDFALWERMLLVNFPFSFVDRAPCSANERRADLSLPYKLKAEGSGILGFLVQGYLEYRQIGLCPPKSVQDAVASYRADEDDLGDFLENICTVSPGVEVEAAVLYSAYRVWLEGQGVQEKHLPSQNSFGRLVGHRFDRIKRGGKKIYQGVCIK